MTATDTPLRSLILADLHIELGARQAGFAGWLMPLQYPDGVKAEHLHTRDQAGLFDVSHMGQLRITARDGRRDTLHRELEAVLPVDFDQWPEGLQKYSLLLNAQAGIEDDLMLTPLGDSVMMIVNAGNRDHDLALLQRACPSLVFDWVDAALIALQGPLAEQVLAGFDPAARDLVFMRTAMLTLDGVPCFTARAGYTGEDGFEISIPAAAADRLVRRLLAIPGVKPIGLGARDSLRLEAGLPLHGQDITPSHTPHEAGLAFAIARSRRADGLKAGGYPGASVVNAQAAHGPRRRLVGLSSFEPVPVRAGAAIIDEQGERVGLVTSGTLSPSLNRPVMLAYLEHQPISRDGTPRLRAQVRTRTPEVMITPLPFVAKRYKR